MDLFRRGKARDRRTAPRTSGQPSVTACFWSGGVARANPVRDISLAGAYIETDVEWCEGTILYMVFEHESEHHSPLKESAGLWVEVVRREEQGMGVQFIARTSQEFKQCEKFMNRISGNDQNKANNRKSFFRFAGGAHG